MINFAGIELARLTALRRAAKRCMRGRPLLTGALELRARIFAAPWEGDPGDFISGIMHGLRGNPPLTTVELKLWAHLPRSVEAYRNIVYMEDALITKVSLERLDPVNAQRRYEIELAGG